MTSLDSSTTGTDPSPAPRLGNGGGDGGGSDRPGYGGRPRQPQPPRFWRRRPFLVGAAVAVVLAVAVVTDIPLSSTPTTRLSDATGTIKEIANDVAGCNAALGEAFTIYRGIAAGTLTKGQRAESTSILSDDANGCSYTNQSIVDLASMGLPQVSIGKNLSHIAGRALAWADPDGLQAIDDIATLLAHPHQAKAAADLRQQIHQLGVDRAAALADKHRLAVELHGTLPPLGLRVIHA